MTSAKGPGVAKTSATLALVSNDGTIDAADNVATLSRSFEPHPGPESIARELRLRIAEQFSGVPDPEFVMFDDGRFYAYQPARGTWVHVIDERVYTLACGMHGMQVAGSNDGLKVNESRANRIVDSLRKFLICEDRYSFARAVHGVAFRDCFVTVESGKITEVPHSPRHLARYRHEVDYEPFETSKIIENHIATVFNHETQEEQQRIVSVLQEWLGASLTGQAAKFQKCLIFVSKNNQGGEGKGSLLQMLAAAFPPDAIATHAPHLWHGFGLEPLIGKLANFVYEVAKWPEEMATFKAIISGDRISADIKFKPHVPFQPIAGHAFSCNDLPPTTDRSQAFYDRCLVLRFERSMRNDDARIIDHASEVLADPVTRARLAAWALKGVARLQKQRFYTSTENAARALAEYRHNEDSVIQWLCANRPFSRLADAEGRISAQDALSAYNEWAKRNRHSELTATAFGRRMAAQRYIRRDNNGKVRGYKLDAEEWNRFLKAYEASQA